MAVTHTKLAAVKDARLEQQSAEWSTSNLMEQPHTGKHALHVIEEVVPPVLRTTTVSFLR